VWRNGREIWRFVRLPSVSKRSLMFVNSLFRVSYGVGALFAPSKMAKLQLAPDTAERPEVSNGIGRVAGGNPAMGCQPAENWRHMSALRRNRDSANRGSRITPSDLRAKKQRGDRRWNPHRRAGTRVQRPPGDLRRLQRSREIASTLQDLIERGLISPIVGSRYPLGGAASALREIDERRATGKVILDVRDGSGQ
jgi:hypothetical protein